MIFLSTYVNKIDSKGRVSVPSQFRNVITAENNNNVILYPSFINECVEACTLSRMNKIADSIDQMDPYSEERDSFAATLLGGCEQLNIDKDGRITLSEKLIEFGNLKGKGVFVGKGQTFEIWNESKFNAYKDKANKVAKDKRGNLKLKSEL